MSESQKYHVGQKVILRERAYRGTREDKVVEISRVGRKYVYVQQGWREAKFHMEDGVEAVDGNYRAEIGTEDDFIARDARVAASARVAHLTSGYSWANGLSTAALTRIADLIEAES